jgi:hypothetical protein
MKGYPIVDQLNLEKDVSKKVNFHTWESLKAT